MISTSKIRSRPASGWLKSTTTVCSSKDCTIPGSSLLLASAKDTSRPSPSSMSAPKALRGISCTLLGLCWPKPCSGSTSKLPSSPGLRPKSRRSNPSSRLPSPTTKVAGWASKVESTTEPSSSFTAKCRVTWVPGPMLMSVIVIKSVGVRLCAVLLRLHEEHVVNQQRGTDEYGRIRDVEGGPLVMLIVPDDKVHHVAKCKPVEQVAN